MFRNVRKHCFPAAGLASVNFVPAFPAYYRYKARTASRTFGRMFIFHNYDELLYFLLT